MAFTWNRNVVAASAGPGAPVVGPASAPPGVAEASDEDRRKVAQLLVDFAGYLSTNAPLHESLAPALREMQTAVAAYVSRQPGDPFGPIKQVLATIEASRRTDPSIPQP
jgi:hypothetical protein